jgi:hypothetical protein
MRILLSFTLLLTLVLLVPAPARAGVPQEGMSDQQFARVLMLFLDDPLHERGKDFAMLLIVATARTPKATVVLGEFELKLIDKADSDRSRLLLGAYLGGNARSQMLSGVKQNDRYSGLVTLFSVYQRLQEKDKEFKIAEVDELRKLHREGKLLAHLVELEKKAPTKLSPEDQKALEQLMNRKK